MKKVLRILAGLIAFVVVILLLAVLYFQVKGIPTFEPKTVDIKIDYTPERVSNGARIAAILCVQCHAGAGGKLVGKRLADIPKEFGEVYSMNITQHPEKGIGQWTDGQLFYFLRTGIRPNGKFTPPYMPKYPTASDEDLKDIIAWLRSNDPALAATDEEAPDSKPSFLTKVLVNTVMGPLPYPENEIPRPDTTDRLAFGAYITNSLMSCYACHSKDFKTNNDLDPVQSAGYLGGGNPLLDLKGNVVVSSNLTFDQTGLEGWTEEEFINAVKYCKRPDGTLLRYPMVPHITLTDLEVASVYEYLKTVPKISNAVARP